MKLTVAIQKSIKSKKLKYMVCNHPYTVEDYRLNTIKEITKIFLENDFLVSDFYSESSFAFDIIAKNEDEIYLIKVVYNIDTLKTDVTREIQRFTMSMDIIAIVIGAKSGAGELEDGVLYFRHKMPILNIRTFRDYMNGIKPSMYSGPGGYYVPIDGERMQNARLTKGYSIGYISNSIGLSRRSVSLYESGSSTTIEVFSKLTKILRENISKPMDLRKITSEWGEIKDDYVLAKKEFFLSALSALAGVGLAMKLFNRFPFDAVATSEDMNIYLTGLSEFPDQVSNNIRMLRNICNIMDRSPLIISAVSTDRDFISGCPVVSIKEILESGLTSSIERKTRKLERP